MRQYYCERAVASCVFNLVAMWQSPESIGTTRCRQCLPSTAQLDQQINKFKRPTKSPGHRSATDYIQPHHRHSFVCESCASFAWCTRYLPMDLVLANERWPLEIVQNLHQKKDAKQKKMERRIEKKQSDEGNTQLIEVPKFGGILLANVGCRIESHWTMWCAWVVLVGLTSIDCSLPFYYYLLYHSDEHCITSSIL